MGKLSNYGLAATLAVATFGGIFANVNNADAAYVGAEPTSCAQLQAFSAAGWNVENYFKNKYGENWKAKYDARATEPIAYRWWRASSENAGWEEGTYTSKQYDVFANGVPEGYFDQLATGQSIMFAEDCVVDITIKSGVNSGISALNYGSKDGSIGTVPTITGTITVEKGASLGIYSGKFHSKDTTILNYGTLKIDGPIPAPTTITSDSGYPISTVNDISLGSGVKVGGIIRIQETTANNMVDELKSKLSAASKATGISVADLEKVKAAVAAGETIGVNLVGTGTADISAAETTKVKTKVSENGQIAGVFNFEIVVSGSRSGALANLTELETPVAVTLEIPRTFQSDVNAKNWYVVRIHGDSVEKLTGSVVKTAAGYGYVVNSDKFSTYALVYDPVAESKSESETEVKTLKIPGAPNTGAVRQ